MPDLPEDAVQAAAEVIGRLWFDGGASGFSDLARAAVEAAAPILAAQVRREVAEQIAAKLTVMEHAYPADIFPPTSDSRDAIGGTAMRHAYQVARRLARQIGEARG